MTLAVIKVGGDVVSDAAQLRGLCDNLRTLTGRGAQAIILHGGGPQVTALQTRLGLVANKVGGRRVTSKEDLVVVEQAICGEVNVTLTAALRAAGIDAFGCHGASGGLVRAVKRPPKVVSGGGPDPVDFGEVGDVAGVNADRLRGLLALGVVPVIATLGISDEGRVFNINADTTVVQIAAALSADALLLITKVGGVFRDIEDPSSLIATLTADEARELIQRGVIVGGMIPKIEEALTVFDAGVKTIAILSAEQEGALAGAVFADGAGGTRVVSTTR